MEANVKKCAILDVKLVTDTQTDFTFRWTTDGVSTKIPLKKEYKYLGAWVDNEFSWEKHINNIKKKESNLILFTD